MDKALLKIMQDRETFYRFKDLIKPYTLSDQSKYILKKYDEYFSSHENSLKIHADDLLSYITHGSANPLSEDKYNNIKIVLESIEEVENDGVADDIIKHYKFLELAQNLADVANGVIDGDEGADLESIQELLDEYHEDVGIVDSMDDSIVSAAIADVFSTDESTPGYDWRLHCLNLAAGKLRGGDLIHVYGRTNSGKTSLIVSETSYIAQQLPEDKTILWINNEEAGVKIVKRYYTCVLGKAWGQLQPKQQKLYQESFNNLCIDPNKLRMYDMPAVTPSQIEAILKKENAGIVVFNNLDKVNGFVSGSGNEAMRLGKLYQWSREMGKKFGHVTFSVGQANVEAENKKRLYLSHMADSKTGKPAELDLAIGIGVVEDEPDVRYINITKNKMDGGKGSCREGLVGIANFNGATGMYTDEEPHHYG